MRGLLGSLYLSCAIWSVIFCLPGEQGHQHEAPNRGQLRQPTVPAGLHRSFNVANAFDRDTVLIVAVNELVFKLADFVDENTKLVRNIRHVIITTFTPEGKLLLPLALVTDQNNIFFAT